MMDSKSIENDKYVEIKETTLFNWINVFTYKTFQRGRINILIYRE